jgi:hypothetical protein
MVSQSESVLNKKARANRRNSRKSTGPRTDAGKLRSSRNACTHGVCSAEHVILEDEDPQQLEGFINALIKQLNPQDILELMVVEEIALAQWRIRRCHRAEARFLHNLRRDVARHCEPGEPAVSSVAVMSTAMSDRDNPIERMSRYEHRLQNAIHRGLAELDKLRGQSRDRWADLGPSPYLQPDPPETKQKPDETSDPTSGRNVQSKIIESNQTDQPLFRPTTMQNEPTAPQSLASFVHAEICDEPLRENPVGDAPSPASDADCPPDHDLE